MDHEVCEGEIAVKKPSVVDTKENQYGPWMVVSYGRYGRNGASGRTVSKGPVQTQGDIGRNVNSINKNSNYVQNQDDGAAVFSRDKAGPSKQKMA
ncbi:hypothetical protein ACOSQ4_004679 [Xanthoceras sorbifolium]